MSNAQIMGTRTIVLSTGVAAASSGAWRFLGGAYSKFSLRACRAGSVGTSNFAISIRAALSTQNSTGAAVGAIGAYTPSTILTYSQAIVGKTKASTGGIPVTHVKYVVTSMTTAASRRLRLELVCVP